MKITFLVGNGFDLSAGLNTSYKEFYHWYCDKSNSLNDSENIKKFKQDIAQKAIVKHDLEKLKNGYWSDLEYGLGKYTEYFKLDEAEEYIECYEDAHDKIAEYIKQVDEKYDKNLITDSALDVFGKSILNFYQELSPREKKIFDDLMDKDKSSSTTINFISFNYTNLLDLYVEGLSKREPLKHWNFGNSVRTLTVSSQVLHIHGRFDFYPILGVSEKEFVKNQELLKNDQISNTLLKGNSVDSLGQYWYEDAKNQINGSSIICVFGMSIGESDSLWWERIMQWLNTNPNRQLILYYHNLQSQDTISIGRRSKNLEKAKDKFTDYSAFTSDHIKNIKERIHVADSGHTLVVPTVKT